MTDDTPKNDVADEPAPFVMTPADWERVTRAVQLAEREPDPAQMPLLPDSAP